MVFGPLITPHAISAMAKATLKVTPKATANAIRLAALTLGLLTTTTGQAQGCAKPVYLTFDTGHMGIASLVADVLDRQQVKVTFFVANERTHSGGWTLGPEWNNWWKERAAEGHEFASHTFDHVYWREDLAGGEFKMRPSSGPMEGHTLVWDSSQYCAEIKRATDRIQDITGKQALPLFRAPGGKTSTRLLAVAKSCGFKHVGWAAAGFLGDELPSEKFSNASLLAKALRDVRSGDILMAHLGIWSRRDPWAPAVLEPLVKGLKARGFCFQTLSQHPSYR
jgi:peptidoglycan-N-acetylmuramic acid deacetylase